MLSSQISIFEILEKKPEFAKGSAGKIKYSKVLQHKEKEYLYFFKKCPLYLIHLPEQHGIKLYMYNPVPMSRHKTYMFDGFEYKGVYYSFGKFYGSYKTAKYKQYWGQLIFGYNSIKVHALTTREIEYICRNIRKEMEKNE